MTTTVSFVLKHPSRDLNDIATAIGLPVARIWTAGQPRKTPKGNPLEGLNKESYCVFEVHTDEGTIAAAVVVVDAALSAATTLHIALGEDAIEKILYCTLIDTGDTVDLGTLRRLVDWGIRLELD